MTTVVFLHHCRWCGKPLDDHTTLYCNPWHRTQHDLRRRALTDKPVQRCPHPTKLAIPYRGTAVLWAAYVQQRFYLCRCGVYHLTSKPHRHMSSGRIHIPTKAAA